MTYEADHVQPGAHRAGWSVVVTGVSRQVVAPDAVARHARTLRPWVDHAMDRVLRIRPELVTGFTLTSTGDGR